MKRSICCLTLTLLAAPAFLLAQTAASTLDPSPSSAQAAPISPLANASKFASPEPFSRLAVSGGVGIGGINMQVAVEASRHLNIRGIGNYFSYNVNNVKVGGSGSNGSDVSGTLSFAEGGVALDYYPWPNHGFRISPGLTFYNQNGIAATGGIAGGNDISLGGTKYYSNDDAPISLNAGLNLNTHKQAFMLTTGWGNMISRKGGHLSFPFEIGAIFTGAPTVGLNIAGYGCTNSEDVTVNPTTDTESSCVNMATDTNAHTNINSQIAKYQKDLNSLQVWPVLTFGVAYNFNIRSAH